MANVFQLSMKVHCLCTCNLFHITINKQSQAVIFMGKLLKSTQRYQSRISHRG